MGLRWGGLTTALMISLAPSDVANASFLDDAWSIVVDPLAVERGSKNVLRTVREARDAITALDSLQESVDENIRFYLKDLDGKIDRLEGATIEVVNYTIGEIRNLEKKVLRDVLLVVRKTECASVRVIDDALAQSLRDLLPGFIEGDKRTVRLPFGKKGKFLFWGGGSNTVEIDLNSGPQPDQVFYEIESAILENLKLADDQSSARKIVGAYGNLARLAKKTQCLYEDQHYGEQFARLYAKYNALVYPWNIAVRYGG